MKRLLFLLAVIMTISCTNQQSKIKGKITGSKGERLYFEHVDASLIKTIDSVELQKSGKFSFSTRVKTPDFYQLRMGNNQIITLLVKPEESIEIAADGNNITNSLEFTGSFESET